jgi:phosphoribosylglycinamide formyltransferase-1
MKNIAIFASGSGTNAQAISEYLLKQKKNYVKVILSNKPNAFVLERSKRLGIPCVVFNREQFYNTSYVIDILKQYNINWVILAGFLWLIPDNLLQNYPNKIVNIHPALLPKYGGKGMFGMKVHEAVVANGEAESGITIHYVNEEYDKGASIFQAKCKITPTDTPDEVAKKIHELEYEHFPRIVECLVENKPIL